MKAGYKKTVAKKDMEKGYISSDQPKQFFSINEDNLPDIKNWKINEEYEVVVTLKMTGIHKMYDSDKCCADFDVVEIEPKEEIKDEQNAS